MPNRQMLELRKQSQQGTRPAKRRIAKKNYRAYYRVGFAGEKSCNMARRIYEFLAKNDKDAGKKVANCFKRLAKEWDDGQKCFLTYLEKIEVVKMKCPSCKGKKNFLVTLSSQTGEYARQQTCQSCDGAGKLPGSSSWAVLD